MMLQDQFLLRKSELTIHLLQYNDRYECGSGKSKIALLLFPLSHFDPEEPRNNEHKQNVCQAES